MKNFWSRVGVGGTLGQASRLSNGTKELLSQKTSKFSSFLGKYSIPIVDVLPDNDTSNNSKDILCVLVSLYFLQNGNLQT